MKDVNIMEVHQILVVGGHTKTIYMGNCLKRGADNLQFTSMHTMT